MISLLSLARLPIRATRALPAFAHVASSLSLQRITNPDGSAGGGSVALAAPDRRFIHASAAPNSTILVGGLTVSLGAVAAIYGLRAYDQYKAANAGPAAPVDAASPGATEEIPPAGGGGGAGETASPPRGSGSPASDAAGAAGAAAGAAGAGPAAPPSGGGMFGAQAFARRFYKGGFEDKMSRREAALVLGVRESATPERIRDRHRKMLMLNHPDTGGSTFLASKLNEAKDVLIKGRGGAN